jgi:hypothetical protein
MNKENIVDVGEGDVSELLESNTVEHGGKEMRLSKLIGDIQTAHKQLDEYKAGSLSLAQTLSEAAQETDDETLRAILSDISDESFGVYLRLHRGDMELLGERDGEYSGHYTE